MAEKENFLFKDSITLKVIKDLGKEIQKHYKAFDQKKYNAFFKGKLEPLSLSERVSLVTEGLYEFLPQDFPKAIQILLKALPPELPNYDGHDEVLDSKKLSSLNGFIMSSLTNYVSQYGMENFDLSMEALKEMTKRFSSEFSARPFLDKHPKKVLELYKKWAKDSNMHVRRLVSESTRPKLPWGMHLHKFIEDPKPVLPLLELLKKDSELYVRRSVANNLNDIAKDHPKIVTDLLKRWSKDKSDEMQWLIRHALRTLIKDGNFEALSILGYSKNPKIKVAPIKLKASKVEFGTALEFSIQIKSESRKDQNLMVDYIVHHKKANGKLAPKVFKFKKMVLKAGESLQIQKKHAMKKITTREYYPGEHKVQMQINGKVYALKSFQLKM